MWLARCGPGPGAVVPVECAGLEECVEKPTADLLRKMRSVLSTPQPLEWQGAPLTFRKESLRVISL